MVIIVCISLFIATAIVSESVGVLARVVGSLIGRPTTGYSTHVRVATLGRFFTLLAAPTLGFVVDKGGSSKEIAFVGFLAFLLIAIMLMASLKMGFFAMRKLFGVLNGCEVLLDSKFNKVEISLSSLCFSTPSLTAVVWLSYSITAIGIILVNYFASLYPDVRATIVQMTAVVTSVGTLLHVFVVDPILSKAADRDPERLYSLVNSYLLIRLLASIILSSLFFLLYLY